MPRSPVAPFLFCGLGLLSLCSPVFAQKNSSPLDQPFAKINGETITYRQYIGMLERQNVQIPGGQTTNSLRFVIDQMIGNQVILTEAARFNAVPTEDEINRYYNVQKKLFEGQYPGRSYEGSQTEQGTTPADVRTDMKYQLAEANLYARKMAITDTDLHAAYDKAGLVGLPARVQLRLVLVAPDSDEMKKAQQLFENKTPFEEVARQVNPAQLRGTAGLVPQTVAVSTLGAEYQAKIEKLSDGDVFGPVDFKLSADQPTAKAWIKLEKKLPPLALAYEDAVPMIKRQIVATKLADPSYAKLRNEIVELKLKAKFEPTDPRLKQAWDSLKQGAIDSGLAPDEKATPHQ